MNDNKSDEQQAHLHSNQAVSDAVIKKANEMGSESEEETEEESTMEQAIKNPTNRSDSSQPESEGEQSMSGATADPESDDDTLENAHAVGEQMGEDEEHPQELDISRDIDEAEIEHRSQ